MAGHSKWANIQHRKGRQDAKKAGAFNRAAREIMVAAKEGGVDPDANPRLRLAITKGKQVNLPKDRIDKALKSAQPGGDGEQLEQIRYEGYGPAGVAVIVEAMTDNRNRAASELRAAFSKNGGNMGESGSVSFMFDQVGQIIYPDAVAADEAMFEAAAEAGAENVESDGEFHRIYCAADEYGTVSNALMEKFGDAEESGLIWRPQNRVTLDLDKAQTMVKLLEALEDLDDVQTVFSNEDIPDEVAEQLE